MSSVPAARAVPIVPFAERLYAPLAPYAYTLIRIATGAIFVPHGVLKLFFGGATSAIGYGFGLLELVGGLAIALGLYARPFAALLILDVLMIIAANIGKGWLWTRGGVQYHSFLLGMCLTLLIGGSGRHVAGYWPRLGFESAWKSLNELLVPIAYAFARVWFALLILPSGYEKVFENGAARIAAGNIVKTGFYPPVFW